MSGPPAWPSLILTAACAAVYLNSFSGPFILDDRLAIVNNPSIRDWWRLGSALFPGRNSPMAGRPLVNLSFALNYAAGGLDVFGYHLVNVAIHAGCALLAFGIVRRALLLPSIATAFRQRATPIAFAAALVWAVHPLNTEAVNYLSQRTEALMALFYLSTLYASIRALTGDRTRWSIAAVGACAAGMACKESMVSAPVAVVLFDSLIAFDSAKSAFAKRWRLYAGLACTWLLAAVLIADGPRADSAGFSTGISPWTYLLNQTIVIVRYLRLAVWPTDLVALYGWPMAVSLGDVLPYALTMALLGVVTAMAVARRSKLAFPAAMFFIALAPTSSIVPIATEVGAERRMYLPLVALAALAVIVCVSAWDRMAGAAREGGGAARLIGPIGLAAVCSTLGVLTLDRNAEYGSGVMLTRTIVDRRPTSLAHQVFGEELMAAGNHAEAIAELRQATMSGDSRAGFTLGAELFAQGKLEEAIDQLQAFVKTSQLPYRPVPHWLEPSPLELLSAHELLGRAYAATRRWSEATDEFRLGLKLNPGSPDFQHLLADAFFSQQRFEDALEPYRAYLAARPSDADALGNFGVSLAALGRTDEAIDVFRRAVAVDPQSPTAQRNLAIALQQRHGSD